MMEEYYVDPENQVLAKVNTNVSVEDVIAETEVSEEEMVNLTKLKMSKQVILVPKLEPI